MATQIYNSLHNSLSNGIQHDLVLGFNSQAHATIQMIETVGKGMHQREQEWQLVHIVIIRSLCQCLSSTFVIKVRKPFTRGS